MKPREPINFTVLWANGLLYLGAFLVVLVSLILLIGIEGIGRTLLASGIALGFLAAGAACRRFEIVRSAGTVFLATGALLVPLAFAALASQLSGGGPLAPRMVWLLASFACAGLYTAMAVLGLGTFYVLLALVAISSVFLALHSAAYWPDRAYPALFAGQALFFSALDEGAGEARRRRFGVFTRVWGWLWTVPALLGWAIVSGTGSLGAAIAALALLVLWAWLTQWRLPNAALPAVAGVWQWLLVAQGLRWLESPWWTIGLGSVLLGAVYVAGARLTEGRAGARGLFALGVVAALVGTAPPFYEEAGGAGLAAAALATFILVVAAALSRRSVVLVPAAWGLGTAWYFALSFFPTPEPTLARLGAAYLPLVVLLTIAAAAVPGAWTTTRRTLAAIVAVYSASTIGLTVLDGGRLSAALAVSTLVWAVLAARFRSSWLVVVPSGTAVVLVVVFLAWMDAPRAALGPAVLALGLALWTVGLLLDGEGTSLPLRIMGGLSASLAFGLGLVSEGRHRGDGVNVSAHLDSLTLAAIALWIAWEARRRRALLYPASLVAVAAGLWELHAFGVEALQVYAVTLGLYFIAAAVLAGGDAALEKMGDAVATLLWIAAGLSFCLPTLGQTFGDRPILYAIVLLGESFVLVVLGLVVKRRALLATASTFVVLAGLRMIFQNRELILPALVSASCLFLSVGLIVLVYQGLRPRAPLPVTPPPDGV